jgi:uncharacterized protein (DUF1330 family)
MSCYAIAQSSVTDPEQLDRYLAAAMPTLVSHGVTVLAFDEAPTAIEGDLEHPRIVILKFETEQAFYDWYDSPEYCAARELRKDAAVGTFTLVKDMSGPEQYGNSAVEEA